MNKTAIFFGAIASAASVNAALAGSGQPFDNLQPSLAVTELMLSHGLFPSRDESGSAFGGTLGFVYDFAGSALPGTTLAANGQTPSGRSNASLQPAGEDLRRRCNQHLCAARPAGQGDCRRRRRPWPDAANPRRRGRVADRIVDPGANPGAGRILGERALQHDAAVAGAADADRDQWRFSGSGRRRRIVRLRRSDRKFRRDLRSERLGVGERPAVVDRRQ